MNFLFIIIFFLYDVFVSRYRNYLNKIYLRKKIIVIVILINLNKSPLKGDIFKLILNEKKYCKFSN